MFISFLDKIRIQFEVYLSIPRLPLRYMIYVLFKPLESTRYVEFLYLLKYLRKINFKSSGKVLDVSSPFMMAYILSKRQKVIKTDISNVEKSFIKQSENLKFQLEDATSLSFENDSFDLVYSISVIEHIYEKYVTAIREMLRVTKPGGLLYISFPVSKEFTEEWIDKEIYTNQAKEGEKVFFQYRFNKTIVDQILEDLSTKGTLDYAIYWEKKDAMYNRYIEKIKNRCKNFYLNFIKDSLLNLFYGYTLLEPEAKGFEHAKNFGNISIILRKSYTTK